MKEARWSQNHGPFFHFLLRNLQLHILIELRRSVVPRSFSFVTFASLGYGCGVYRKYGFITFTPFGNFFCASSVEIEGTTITSSPSFQSAGVATLWLAVSCSESTTRS